MTTAQEVAMVVAALLVLACALVVLGVRIDRRGCRHDRVRGIYGDEIHAAGGHRSRCQDCGKTWPDPERVRP